MSEYETENRIIQIIDRARHGSEECFLCDTRKAAKDIIKFLDTLKVKKVRERVLLKVA